jgi:hypothetical protein
MFITFIFKLPNNLGQTLYGKYYTDYIYDEHEGLDKEIKHYLLKGINEFQNLKLSQEVENIHIGIISVSDHNYISINSTDEEIKCFDFYCKKFTINHKISLTMYMFGKLIESSCF